MTNLTNHPRPASSFFCRSATALIQPDTDRDEEMTMTDGYDAHDDGKLAPTRPSCHSDGRD